ncbi:PIR protein [Plasmodium vivax]|nr:PIR protein [Plasmodium vivax]
MEPLGLFDKLQSEINKIPEIAFDNSLYADISHEENIDQYITGCFNCRDPFKQTKVFISKLARNYENYKKHLGKPSFIKYCKYLIYWMYTEKLKFLTNSLLLNQWKNCIPCVWKKLEENNNIPKRTCDFDNEEISYSFVQVMKVLHEMCLIRGDAEVIESITSDREKCMQFNKKIKKNLKDMLLYISTISGETKLKENYFKLYNGCALRDVRTLFEEIECKSEETKSPPEPKACDTAPPSTEQECTEVSCPNLQQLCTKHYPPTNCEFKEKVIQPDCQQPPPDILLRLCPEVCTEKLQYVSLAIKEHQEKSNKNPLLQVPVTVLSSVVGTIFFFLLLYKFTPFRSWFLNRIGSKKTLNHKMRQEMEREYLGAHFQPPYRDEQNSRPRVGYSQN